MCASRLWHSILTATTSWPSTCSVWPAAKNLRSCATQTYQRIRRCATSRRAKLHRLSALLCGDRPDCPSKSPSKSIQVHLGGLVFLSAERVFPLWVTLLSFRRLTRWTQVHPSPLRGGGKVLPLPAKSISKRKTSGQWSVDSD